MSYVARTYPDVVRDLLTTLTGGVVREHLTVPPGDDPVLVLPQLAQRPVRRVSHLNGRVRIGSGPDAPEVDYRFTPADFELVSSRGDGDLDAVAFRPGARRPVPLSAVVVNYYPVDAAPVPLTDLNVGSVVRTLTETIARELALTYEHLGHVYDSAFLETAEGSALDRVVALVGVTRLAAGHPVVTVRFGRRPGTPGRITVPARTPLVDRDGNRYLTVRELTLEPGEQSRTVTARGESPATPVVDVGVLREEVILAGISEVSNVEPGRALAVSESDADLRRRARAALHGVSRGTVDALRYAVRSVAGVKNVTVTEFPNGVPGEIRVTVAYDEDTAETRSEVALVIDRVRPAGIRVLSTDAAPQRVDVELGLTVAGAVRPPTAEMNALQEGAVARVSARLRALPPGGKIRRAQLASAVLEDQRIIDVAVAVRPDGAAATEDHQLPDGAVLQLGTVTVTGVETEVPGSRPPPPATVDLAVPLHLAPGVTVADAETAVRMAVDSYLAGVLPQRPLTVDALLAALRDDTRYAAVRPEVVVTVSFDGRFLQLTDGQGSYAPAPGQALVREALVLDVREGAV